MLTKYYINSVFCAKYIIMFVNFVIFCLLSVKIMHVITVQYKSRTMYICVNDEVKPIDFNLLSFILDWPNLSLLILFKYFNCIFTVSLYYLITSHITTLIYIYNSCILTQWAQLVSGMFLKDLK